MKVKDLLHLDPETEIVLWYWDGEKSRYYIANPTCSNDLHPKHFAITVSLCLAYNITDKILKEIQNG